jgi:hypothetical protein
VATIGRVPGDFKISGKAARRAVGRHAVLLLRAGDFRRSQRLLNCPPMRRWVPIFANT